MKQQCSLWMVWMTWLGVPTMAVLVGLRLGVASALVVVAVGIVGQWLYVRWFPKMSMWMGYGSVADAAASVTAPAAHLPKVTLYTANVCPFCPIIKQRLAALQQQMRFDVEEVDVTFRPEIVRAKGLRSVPAMEANGQLLVGNSTSAQIVEFLRAAAADPAVCSAKA